MKSILLRTITAIAVFFGLSLFLMVLTGGGGIRARGSVLSEYAAEKGAGIHPKTKILLQRLSGRKPFLPLAAVFCPV